MNEEEYNESIKEKRKWDNYRDDHEKRSKNRFR